MRRIGVTFHTYLLFLGLFGALLLESCHFSSPNVPPEITYSSPQDFEEAQDAAVSLQNEFTLELWAPGSLLASPVSLTFSPTGEVYVSETTRRKSSDIDIRQHRDWMTEDLSLSSLEDTEAFHKEKLDPKLGKENTWQEDFNGDGSHDWRDLMVQSERIRKIWDEDGDGKADASIVYGEDFRDMLAGVAAGIQYHNGEIFLSCAPDLWRLQDTDGDGDMDKKTSVSHGYGIHIGYAGHDMSGVTVGPDGKIYWSIGDLGVNTVDNTGKRWAYPHHGAVMRANPDGSDFEVFAFGLRNPQELAFDAFGNLISVDNDGDHPGEHERIVHILEGSDSGWRTYWQFGKYNQPGDAYKVWMDEKLHVPHFEGQAAYLLPPIALADNGPAGLAYNPGTALGEKWKGYFFSSHFTASTASSKIRGIKLKPKGASFEVVQDTAISVGIVSTGLSFGPDGALYIADWLESYDKKPFGRIWKMDVADSLKSPLRVSTQQILQEGFKSRSLEELASFLAHEDMRIRMEAQFSLVRKKEAQTLKNVAASSQNLLARLHAIWGLGQLARKNGKVGEDILPFLKDSEGEVRAQASKVLGDAKIGSSESSLIELLKDPYPRTRYFAAEALGKLQAEAAFPSLIDLIAETREQDPHMRHGLILALSRLASSARLENLSEHSSPYVRVGAVVALRRQRAPGVSTFLQDSDSLVRIEAARAIHDDEEIPEAFKALANSLTLGYTEIPYVRRAINANLKLGTKEAAERLAAYADNERHPISLRKDALWALSHWPEPPVLDRVDGKYREPNPTNPEEALATVEPYIKRWIRNSPEELRITALQLVKTLNPNNAKEWLSQIATNSQEPEAVRGVALQAMSETDHPDLEEAVEIALLSNKQSIRKEGQALISKLPLSAEKKISLLATALKHGGISEKQQILASLGEFEHPNAESLLENWVAKFEKGNLEKELLLDVFEAVEKSSYPDLKERTKTLMGKEELRGGYEMTLFGGNPQAGRKILIRHQTAQCLRCHQIKGYGGIIGPELSQIASQLSRKELMESLVYPSMRIAPGYGSLILDLQSGDKVSGTLVSSHSDSLTLRIASGELLSFAEDNVSGKEQGPSAMPSMQHILNLGEIRDLVAFLSSLK